MLIAFTPTSFHIIALHVSSIMYNSTSRAPYPNLLDARIEYKKLLNILSLISPSNELLALGSSRVRVPRKPRKGNTILSSSLRPHVLADKRLIEWHAPYSLAFRHSRSISAPRIDVQRALEVMSLSLDTSTRSGYGAGLLRFTQFCDSKAIPEDDRMPASDFLLAMFVADAAGKVSASAVNTWCAGLHFWHTVNGAAWRGGEMLSQMKKGVKKLVPMSSKRKKR